MSTTIKMTIGLMLAVIIGLISGLSNASVEIQKQKSYTESWQTAAMYQLNQAEQCQAK